MSHIISYAFYTYEVFKHATCFMSFEWWKKVGQLTKKSQVRHFTLWFIVSLKGRVT